MQSPARLACDVDLARLHSYSERDGIVCYNAPEWPWEALLSHDLILVEAASAVSTARCEAEAYNRRRWAIGNSLQIGRLLYWATVMGRTDALRLAPAEAWTCGHPESLRELAAGVAGQDNHDIRACRCMLYYYNLDPSPWKPVQEFLDTIAHRTPKRPKPARKASR